ncbi:MAG: zf-HC2 domain-containing protein [Planctomycetaceae bacterium]|nr:zf-HC2 domain-containing protein [Planctomycetaceae bacterium]
MNEQDKFQLQNQDSNWRDCQAGDIGKVSAQLKRRRRVRTIQQRGAVLGLILIAVVGLGWFTMHLQNQDKPGGHLVAGLYCSEVADMAEKLFAGELENKQVAQITGHLDGCPDCVEHLEKARQEYEERTGEKAKFQYPPEPKVVLAPLMPRGLSVARVW